MHGQAAAGRRTSSKNRPLSAIARQFRGRPLAAAARRDGSVLAREGCGLSKAGDGGERSVKDEEEIVDDDARDGDVEPERERPASDGFVAMEAAAQSEIQSDEHERNDGSGENGMADEKRKIRGANWAVAGETDHAGVGVKVEIGSKKARGADEGGEHAGLVLENLAAANEKIARAQKDRAGGVENRVKARKRAERK